ncbi:MAG: appB [Bacillota bacterium]|nr:MAG: appB [Bacillota bacterium]
MARYILNRTIQAVLLLLGVSIISFVIMLLAPGGPTDFLIDSSMLSGEDLAAIRTAYGLDRHEAVQYWKWVSRVVVGDFGTSFHTGRPVLEMIMERLPATLALNLIGMVFIYLIALPTGIISAVKQYSVFDYTVTLITFLGQAMPAFWLALLLLYYVGLKVDLPLSGMATYGVEFKEVAFSVWLLDRVRYMVLPLSVVVLTGLAALTRFMRASMLDVIHQDYIRTARAKGLSELRVITRHALRNALLPIVTLFGLTFSVLLSGSVVIERIFSWPGVGQLAVDSILKRDYQVVMAFNMIGAFMVIAGSFLADMLYVVVDPRIKY